MWILLAFLWWGLTYEPSGPVKPVPCNRLGYQAYAGTRRWLDDSFEWRVRDVKKKPRVGRLGWPA